MNKNLLISSLLITGLATGINAADVKLDAAKLKEIRSTTRVLQNPVLTIKDGIDKDSVYFLKIEAKSPKGSQHITAFVDKKTGAVYFGNGIDKEGKSMVFPKEAQVIKDGISFSYGTGKKDLYLVTDPECPYCSKFEKAATGKLDDYTVHVILFPLPFHKKAPALVEWILQGKDNAQKRERFEQLMLKGSTEYKALIKDEKKPFKYTTATQEKINKSLEAVNELGARGTPTTFDASFNNIPLSVLLPETKQK